MGVVRMDRRRELAHLKTIKQRFEVAKLVYHTSRMLKAEPEQTQWNRAHAISIMKDYNYYRGEYNL